MKIIKVLDHEIKVYLEDPEEWTSGGMGRASVKSGIIRINKNMSDDTVQSTFIHELVHIIADLNSIELNEQTVDGIALGIHSFLKNNYPKNILEMKDDPE